MVSVRRLSGDDPISSNRLGLVLFADRWLLIAQLPYGPSRFDVGLPMKVPEDAEDEVVGLDCPDPLFEEPNRVEDNLLLFSSGLVVRVNRNRLSFTAVSR